MINNNMSRDEIIRSIIDCIEVEGDGGFSIYTSEQKEEMIRFMNELKTIETYD